LTDKKVHPINLDEDIFELLKAEQKRRNKTPLRHIVHSLIREGLERQRNLGRFDDELEKHIASSSDKSFLQYLNSPFIGDLIRLLDETRPTYQDIAVMSASIVYWGIKSREFFKTVMVYSKFGVTTMKGDE